MLENPAAARPKGTGGVPRRFIMDWGPDGNWMPFCGPDNDYEAMRLWRSLWLLVGGLVVLVAPAVAQPAPKSNPANPNQCFTANQFQNWRAADAKTLYIRVRGNHIFRLDLAGRCMPLLSPGARLITIFRGTTTVCSALDWDLRASAGINGIAEPCLVKKMTELTPAEIKALPKKAMP